MASISAPRKCAVDERIRILIENLQPKQKVAVIAQTTRNDVTLTSFANYESTDSGCVDLTRHGALSGGTYEGCDPMGLFSSSALTSDLKIPFRMLNGNDLESWVYTIRVFDGHLHSMDDALSVNENQPLAQTNVERLFVPTGVRRFNVYYGKMRGALFLPQGDGPFPAVIDIFGGAHGLVAYRGGLFARHGYACLCVAYAAYADLPKILDFMDIEYFNECFDFLSRHPSVDKNRIGVFGSCLGGTIAMALARRQPGIKAVVAISPEAFAGTWRYRMKLNGKDHIVPGMQWREELVEVRDDAYYLRSLFNALAKDDWRPHSLEYGLVAAPVLFFYGTHDAYFNLDLFLPIIKEQFGREKKLNAEIITYEGAGHIIQPPYLPLFAKYYSPMFKHQIWFGGLAGPHAKAQENMWERTLDFFSVHLSSSSSPGRSRNIASKL